MALILGIILIILMIAIGEERGVAGVFVLIGNMILLWFCIKLIADGCPIFFILFMISIIFTGMTLFVQNGLNRKTVSAFISVIIIMAILLIFCGYCIYRMGLGGYNEFDLYGDEAPFLNNKIHIDSFRIMTSVVILGLLGAITDTALSVSSSVFQIFESNPALTEKELRKSGNNIGRDILGTTVNTLFFAGIGESLLMFMMCSHNRYNIGELLNSKAFLQQLFVMIIANLGCICVLPVSAWISAWIYKKTYKE